jgi:hypothetical protein
LTIFIFDIKYIFGFYEKIMEMVQKQDISDLIIQELKRSDLRRGERGRFFSNLFSTTDKIFSELEENIVNTLCSLEDSFLVTEIIKIINFAAKQNSDNESIMRIKQSNVYSCCHNTSFYLLIILKQKIPNLKLAISNREDGNSHHYLLIQNQFPEDDIIIDPTIGQFIEGFHGVFVGTRKLLKLIVLRSKIHNTRSKNNPTEAFERIWGNNSCCFKITDEESEIMNKTNKQTKIVISE